MSFNFTLAGYLSKMRVDQYKTQLFCAKALYIKLQISIEYPVGLPVEHDGVHPQAEHEQDDQHLQ